MRIKVFENLAYHDDITLKNIGKIYLTFCYAFKNQKKLTFDNYFHLKGVIKIVLLSMMNDC